MSQTIPAVSEETISAWVGPRSLQLGRGYFENEAIFDLRRQGNSLKAYCQGSMPQPYRLRIAFGVQGIETAHCSCPVGGGGHCKHVGGLLLAWMNQPNAFRAVAELDADLEGRGKAELIALIKQMLRLQPELETLLEVALPAGDRRRTPVNPEIYLRQVSSAFRRGGNDWMMFGRIAEEVEGIVSAGDDFLALEDYASASAVYQAAVQGMLEHHELVYADEDGRLGYVVDQCVEGLGSCLAGGGDNTADREGLLQTLFEIYRSDLDYGGIGLGEAAPGLILEHATEAEKRIVAGWVRSDMAQGSSRSHDYLRQVHGRFLLDLEIADLDDDAFLSVCRENGLLVDLVGRLLTLGRLDEAISEAERAGDYRLLTLAELFRHHGCAHSVEPLLIRRNETSPDRRLVEWLKARHKERGELSEALALARQLLRARPHLAGYREVRELSRQLGGWPELRPELLAEWADDEEYGLLTDIYLEEDEIELALKSVKQSRLGTLHGAEQLTRVALAAASAPDALAGTSRARRMLDEYAMLGLCPDGHVMELLRPQLGPEVLTSDGLLGCRDGDVVRVAGRVVRRQRPLATAVFLTLEDEFGLIPLAVWPAQWERLKGALRRSLVVVEGQISRRDDTLNVAAQNAWPLALHLDYRYGRRDWR